MSAIDGFESFAAIKELLAEIEAEWPSWTNEMRLMWLEGVICLSERTDDEPRLVLTLEQVAAIDADIATLKRQIHREKKVAAVHNKINATVDRMLLSGEAFQFHLDQKMDAMMIRLSQLSAGLRDIDQ